MRKLGKYLISNEEYHGDKDFISRSGIMDFKRSPFYYYSYHVMQAKKEETRSMLLGSAFHSLILMPEEFDKTYALKPEKVLLKNEGREKYDNYRKKISDIQAKAKIILTVDEMSILHGMRASLLSHDKIVDLLKGEIENSFFFKDQESGVFLKSRPDIVYKGFPIDLKTCDKINDKAYQNSMTSYGYHIQAAMAIDALEQCDVNKSHNAINICVEKTYPYECAIIIIDEEAINFGRYEYKKACEDIRFYQENGWKIDTNIKNIGLPRWYCE